MRANHLWKSHHCERYIVTHRKCTQPITIRVYILLLFFSSSLFSFVFFFNSKTNVTVDHFRWASILPAITRKKTQQQHILSKNIWKKKYNLQLLILKVCYFMRRHSFFFLLYDISHTEITVHVHNFRNWRNFGIWIFLFARARSCNFIILCVLQTAI